MRKVYSCSFGLFLVDHTALHDEADVLNRADVLQRISWHCDDVGEIPGFKRSDLLFPSEQLRAIDQVCLKHRLRCQAVLHHKEQFASLRAVGKWADVRSNGHGNSSCDLLLELLNLDVEHLT